MKKPATTFDLTTLQTNARNPQITDPARLERLRQSLAELPKMMRLRPLVYDPDTMTVLGGNKRLTQLLVLGYTTVPAEWVASAHDFTPEERRRFVIADNVGFGTWDADILTDDYTEEELEAWGLQPDDWADDPEEQEAPTATDDHYAPPPDLPTDIVPGDLITIGHHRLLCGDSTNADDVAKLMDGEKANAVLTDPPYGQNQPGVTNDSPEIHRQLLRDCISILPIENAVIVAFNSPRTFPAWLIPCLENGHKFERMFWLYKKAQNAYPFRGWLLISEAILVSSVGDPNWNDVHPYSHDCYEVSEVSNELPEGIGWHGSVKPVKVVADLCSRISFEKDIVLDPFLGSGTTLVASHQLNRRCYGLEIDPKYCQIIIDRMYKLDPALPITINGTPYTPGE